MRAPSAALLVPVAGTLVLAALPLVLTPYTHDLMVKIAIYAVFALSLELLVGMTGLVSLGHAAFFGIGAYPTALRPCAGRHPGQRAAHARGRLSHLRLQAGGLRGRRRAGGAGRLPAGGEGRRGEPGTARLERVRRGAADGDPGRHRPLAGRGDR